MSAEIVRDVVEARAELYRAAGERAADHVEPAESVTPPSQPDPEQEREYRHLSPPQVRRSPRRAAIRATSHVRPIRHGHAPTRHFPYHHTIHINRFRGVKQSSILI